MKKLIVLFCSVFLTLSLYSQREISFDVYGDISENAFYQEFTRESQDLTLKYNQLREQILHGEIDKGDKLKCITLIKEILKNPTEIESNLKLFIDSHHPIFDFIAIEDIKIDLSRSKFNISARQQLKKYHKQESSLESEKSNPDSIHKIPFFLDSLYKKLMPNNANLLINGYINIKALPHDKNVSYTYWVSAKKPFRLMPHWKNYKLYHESSYLSSFDFSFYLIEEKSDYKGLPYDFVLDMDRVTNMIKGEFEERLASTLPLVKSGGYFILALHNSIIRSRFEKGTVICGNEAESLRISKRKLKKILKQNRLSLEGIENFEGHDYVIIKKEI